MREDKQQICDLFLKVLQATDYFSDLKDLVYAPGEYGQEYVVATFEGGAHKVANVTADSGVAVLKDILKQMV